MSFRPIALGIFFLSILETLLSPVWAATRLPVYGKQGMVVSTSDLASEVGAQILRDGGNAADAAVAVAMALAVTWPSAGNLGGGGFALVRTPKGESSFVDYREIAPQSAHENFYLDAKGQIVPGASTVGYRAAGVPGTVAGMEYLHRTYGRLPWKKLIEPARRLAADGYRLQTVHVREIASERDLLQRFPATKAIFFPEGRDPEMGDRFIQRDLARSLALLEKEGPQGFYKGTLAKLLVQDIQKQGGALTAADFAGYKVEVREPLKGQFGPYEVLSSPPPSSGGATLLQMLGMMGGDDLKTLGFGSARYLHLLVEVMKRAFADRSEWYGDPAFVHVPLIELLKPTYLRERRASILDKAVPSLEIKPARVPEGESHETTHFTIIDREGMVVTNTYTLNGSFGSGVVVPGTGILLNNEMDDFTSKPGEPNMYGLIQGKRNSIAPRKRPLSSMTPTIFVKDGRAVLALGSPGGPTIINTVLQVSLNVLVQGWNVQSAVEAPRIHHQWMPDEIRWEPQGINPDTRKIMESMGHVFAKEPRSMGDAQAIVYDPERKEWSGGADSRRGGKAVAP